MTAETLLPANRAKDYPRPGGPAVGGLVGNSGNDALARLRRLALGLEEVQGGLAEECGWPAHFAAQDYRDLCARDAYSNRALSALSEECWGAAPQVYENAKEGPGSDTPFDRGVRAHLRDPRTHYWSHLKELDRVTGEGRFGALLIGLPGDLAKPPPGVRPDGSPDGRGAPGPNRLLYLKAYGEADGVRVTKVDNDPASPRFLLPLEYEFRLPNPLPGAPSLDAPAARPQKVHWTRVLHATDGPGPLASPPRLEPVLDRLLDLRKVQGSSPEMFYKGAFFGLAITTIPEAAAAGAKVDRDSVDREMGGFFKRLSRYIALQNLDAKVLAPSVADPTPHVDIQLRAICAQLRMPLRIFLGSESGHMASLQDDDTWKGRVQDNQADKLGPRYVRGLVDRLVLVRALPAPAAGPQEYISEWGDNKVRGAKERADVAVKVSQALFQYASSGAERYVPFEHYLAHVLQWPAEVCAAVAKAARAQPASALLGPPLDARPDAGMKNPAEKTGAAGNTNGAGAPRGR